MDDVGRRHPAHGTHIFLGTPTIVFLTVCTKDRAPWLACEAAHATLRDAWAKAETWRVGRYILMPDHLHLFCSPANLETSLETWVRYWKSWFRKQCGSPDWRWQSHHWDTRLRRGESYSTKWEYVVQNPVRAGLVGDSSEWPYQGECHVLSW
jgi:Transposase and inactivated derivatives